MINAQGYSLWLIPSDNVYSQFQELIKRLSIQYKTPSFLPHITLLGSIDNEGRLTQDDHKQRSGLIANKLAPLKVKLGIVKGEPDKWWKRIYVEASGLGFDQAYKIACSVYSMSISDFQPHLSLLYSDQIGPTVTESLTDKLKTNYKDVSFTTNKIYLVDTNGAVEEWRVIEKFSL